MRLTILALLCSVNFCWGQQFNCGSYICRQLPAATNGEFYTRIDSVNVAGSTSTLTQKVILNTILTNAVAYYNGYLWAWKQYQNVDRSGGGGKKLLKVNNLGTITSYPFESLEAQYNAATIDNNGVYYNVESPSNGATSFTLNRINLIPSTPVLLSSVSVNLPSNMYWPEEGCGDIIMLGSTMYMYLNQRGLLKINLLTGTSQRLYVSASDTNRIIGCVFEDAGDNLNLYGYGSNSYSGSGTNTNPMQNILQINLATGAIQTITTGGTQTSQADGASCAAASIFTLTVKGKYFNDRDGNTIVNNNEKGIKGPGNNGGICASCPAMPTSYMNLTNASNVVIECVPVNQDGSYIFLNVPPSTNNLRLQLSNALYIPGQTVSGYSPGGVWSVTGENNSGTNSGNGDGNPDFKISITTTPASGSIIEQNFGVERLPETDNKVKDFGLVTLSTSYPLSDVPLSGSDPEDSPTAGSINTNGKFVITALPPAGKAVLYYNGVAINNLSPGGYTINSYNPNLLSVKFGSGITSTGTSFTYATQDDAQQRDQSPAVYQLNTIGSVPLAVSGLQLKGITSGKNIRLEWKTLSENNASHFNVERSSNGSTFDYMGTTTAANNPTGQAYSFTDFYVSANINYYRIVAVDKDFSKSYSNVIVVRLNKDNSKAILFPNPAADKISISIADGDAREVTLVNVNGTIVKKAFIEKGNSMYTMGVADLAAGIYKVILSNSDKKQTESLLLIIQ